MMNTVDYVKKYSDVFKSLDNYTNRYVEAKEEVLNNKEEPQQISKSVSNKETEKQNDFLNKSF